MKIGSKSENSIAFIRYFLASVITFYHIIVIGYFDNGINTFTFKAFTDSFENLGGIAVGAFFILSGYLVTNSYIRVNSLFRFLWHRFLRIFPGYWFCLFVSVFIIGPIIFYIKNRNIAYYFSYPLNSPFAYIYSNFFLLIRQQNIANIFINNFPPRFNDSLWTLFYEFLCYLCIAFLGTLGIFSKSKKIILGIFLTLWLTFNLFFTNLNSVKSTFLLFEFFKLSTYFFMGSVFYIYRDKIILNKIILFFLLLISVVFVYFKQFFLIAPFLIAYSLFIAINKIPFKRFDRYGDFSYGLYLYHFPIGQTLVFFGFHNLGLLPFFLISIIIGTIIAAISYWLIEFPCSKLKNINLF